MRWIPTKGMRPRTKAEKVWVKWRNGMMSKQPYPVEGKGGLRWHWVGDDWDIMAYYGAEEERQEAA